jgi:hypothetical protein
MITTCDIFEFNTQENILTQKRKCTAQSDARYQVNSLRPRLHCTGFTGHDIFAQEQRLTTKIYSFDNFRMFLLVTTIIHV